MVYVWNEKNCDYVVAFVGHYTECLNYIFDNCLTIEEEENDCFYCR